MVASGRTLRLGRRVRPILGFGRTGGRVVRGGDVRQCCRGEDSRRRQHQWLHEGRQLCLQTRQHKQIH